MMMEAFSPWEVFVLRTNAVTFLMSLTRKIWTWMKLGFATGVTQCFVHNASGGGLTSLFPHLNAYLSPISLFCHVFVISFVQKSVFKFEILNLFFGLQEKYKACIKIQNFFTWMKVYNSLMSRKVEKINSDHCFAQNLILCGSGPIQEPQKTLQK